MLTRNGSTGSPTRITLSAEAVSAVMSESITSTGPSRVDPEPSQPGGGVVPDQFLRRDVEAVEFQEGAPGKCVGSMCRLASERNPSVVAGRYAPATSPRPVKSTTHGGWVKPRGCRILPPSGRRSFGATAGVGPLAIPGRSGRLGPLRPGPSERTGHDGQLEDHHADDRRRRPADRGGPERPSSAGLCGGREPPQRGGARAAHRAGGRGRRGEGAGSITSIMAWSRPSTRSASRP